MPRAEPPGGSHWFESAAEHLGAAYLRYSFTKGTTQEVDFLVDELGLVPGMDVLDVGCGPGRHALELAARGMHVTGVDISQRFVDLAAASAAARGLSADFVRRDARALDFVDRFDAVISLCQGAFGLQGPIGSAAWAVDDGDASVLDGIAAGLRRGGRVAVSAFSSYFQVRFLEHTDRFEAATGVNHERTELRDDQGTVIEHDLWTTCFTPRELRLMAHLAGLEVTGLYSVTPGDYARRPPVVDLPEFLVVASKP